MAVQKTPQGENPPPGVPDAVLRQLVDLCKLARDADQEGLRLISMSANEIILYHRIPPEKILATIGWCSARAKLLTGHVTRPAGYRNYTEDEVVDLMQRYPKFTVKCMQLYPGKRNAIDLTKVVKDLNKGVLKQPELW